MNKNVYALEYVQSHRDDFEGVTANNAYATYTVKAVADEVDVIYLNNFSFLVSCMGYDIRDIQGARTFTRKQIRKQTRPKGVFVPKRNY